MGKGWEGKMDGEGKGDGLGGECGDQFVQSFCSKPPYSHLGTSRLDELRPCTGTGKG